MAQQNENNHSLDSTTEPVKRKRGRPRKEDAQGTQSSSGTQRRRRNSLPATTTTSTITASTTDDFVGQQVSGILDGVFDAGFLLTVRVNNGNIFKGMVFDSKVAIPITASNDVAPHVKMCKREEFAFPVPISAEPLQRREPLISKVVNDIKKESQVLNSKAETLVKILVSDGQSQGLTGELKLDSTSKTAPCNESTGNLEMDSTKTTPAGELKPDSTSKTSSCNESLVEMELDSTDKTTQAQDTTAEQKLEEQKLKSRVNESASENPPKNQVNESDLHQSELFSTEDTTGKHKLDNPSKTSLSKKTSEEQNLESQANENSSEIPPQTFVPSLKSELKPKDDVKTDNGVDQNKPIVSEAAATEALN